jgi:hypothetical protein
VTKLEWFRQVPLITYGSGLPSRYSDGLHAGQLEFYSRQGQEIYLYPIAFRPALEPTQHSYTKITGGSFPGDISARREADHSPPSAKRYNGGAVSPLSVRLHGVVLNYLSTETILLLAYH